MLASHRIRLQQIIREAEGYLELSMLFADDFDTTVARKLATPLALAALSRVREAGGLKSHALYLKGEALRCLEQYHQALVPLEAAAQLDPENIHIALALGWCYKRVGRIDLAIESLERSLEYDNGSGILFYNLACYWSLAGGKEHALEYLSQAFAINPDYRDMVGKEHDFDPLRSDADFQSLISIIV
jgi:tetratricopeptide (TPR) repeat protein